MKVNSIMSQPVIVVGKDDSLEQVARTMLENNIGGVPVVDASGAIVGMITESDFGAKSKSIPFSTFRSEQVLGQWLSGSQLAQIYDAARDRQARDIMSRNVRTLTEDDTIETAAALLLKHDITRLPVVRDGRPVGILARRDLLKLMLERSTQEERDANESDGPLPVQV